MQVEESPEIEATEPSETEDVVDPTDHDALRDAIHTRLTVEGQSYRDLLLADIAAGMYEFRMMVEGLTSMMGDGSGPMGKIVGRMIKKGKKG